MENSTNKDKKEQDKQTSEEKQEQEEIFDDEEQEEVFYDPNDVQAEVIFDPNEVEPEEETEETEDIKKTKEEEEFDEEEGEEGEEEQFDFSNVEDQSVATFSGHSDCVYCIDMHPNFPNLVVTGGCDDKAFAYNLHNGEKVLELTGHTDTVTSVKFSMDAKFLATSSYDNTVKLWDTSNGKLFKTLEGPSDANEFIVWHPKGNVLLAGSRDGTAWLWNSSGSCLGVFAGHSGPITCGDFSLDGKLIITGSEDSTIRIWDPKTAQTLHVLKGHGFHSSPVHCMAIHPANQMILSGGEDGKCLLSGISNGKAIGKLVDHEDSVESVGFHSNGIWAASASLDKKLKIWNISTMQLITTCEHLGGITKLKWDPIQPLIYSSSADGTIKMWDSRSGKLEKSFSGHKATIMDFTIKKDSSVLVTVSDDHTSKVFKLQ